MGCCSDDNRVHSAQINGRILEVADDFQGPVKDRSCQNLGFLILFVAFCVGGVIYIGYAAYRGDPDRLFHGYDSYGNVCGKKNPTLFNLSKSGQDFTNKRFFQVLERTCEESCLNNSAALGYYCIPFLRKDDSVVKGLGLNDIEADLRASWREIVYISLVGLGFTIVMAVMLRFVAWIIIWITVAIVIIGSIAGSIALWVLWDIQRKKVQEAPEDSKAKHETLANNLLIGAIVATIATVIVLLILFVLRSRINLVIELFKEAGKAVAAMPFLLLQPFWTFLVMIAMMTGWLAGLMVILSSGDPVLVNKEYVVYKPEDPVLHMRWYHIFALFWVTQFILACQDLAIAGSVAIWYFLRDKSKLGWPILTSIKRLILYHLGSVAIGSLIIAIMQLIRALLKFVEHRVQGSANPFCLFILKCCQCYIWCLENVLRYLSKNAYIEIGIYGFGFFKAAKKAFEALGSNALRVFAINSIGSFVLFLTKVAVVIPTVFIGIEIMKSQPNVHYWWLPIAVGGAITFVIVHIFISVYEMTIDTLFICFCEDCAINDGINKPYFMSRGLMQFVENSEKAIEALEARKNTPAKEEEAKFPGNIIIFAGKGTPALHVQNSGIGSQVSSVHGGMTPLYPGYPSASHPPSPSHLLPPPG